jgi:uncharacterized protein YecE (DUF72 family)
MAARGRTGELFSGGDVVPSLPPQHVELARRLFAAHPHLRLGTSSWSFPGWRGITWRDAHDDKVLSRHGLTAYAAQPLLSTVSIDRGHYQPIDDVTLAGWAAQVPASFRFVLKGWSAMTTPVVDGQPSPDFLDATLAREHVVEPAVKGLGDKLGVLLFQFPPAPMHDLGGDAFVPRLRAFLDALRPSLPASTALAVELRTPQLVTHVVRDMLFDVGAVPSLNLRTGMPDLHAQLRGWVKRETPVLVVRWLLRIGLGYEDAKTQYAPFDTLADPDPSTRGALAEILKRAPMPAFVLANNKAEGSAPRTLQKLAEAIVG